METSEAAPDLRGGKGPGPRPPYQRGPPTMFMCLAICACDLVIFSEESCSRDAYF